MTLWIAIKYSPLALKRDSVSRINYWRLDNHWFLPKYFNYSYAQHVEVVITQVCTKTSQWARCMVCDTLGPLNKEAASDVHAGVHYITYKVDPKAGVNRMERRHSIAAPRTPPENNETWEYFKIPCEPAEVTMVMTFLESQLSKPIRQGYMLNYFCLCRNVGVNLGDNFMEASSWTCSELVSAALILYCPAFETINTRHPCTISPCVLDSMLRQLNCAGTPQPVTCIRGGRPTAT